MRIIRRSSRLLAASSLCTYYRLDEHAGRKVAAVELPGRFDYLARESVQSQLLAFRSPTLARPKEVRSCRTSLSRD